MFEARHRPLAARHVFFKRMTYTGLLGLLLVAVSLSIGILGYRYFENMGWIESYETAAMILSGIGATEAAKTDNGRVFSGTYALFSGIVFLVAIGIMFAPLFHRFMHKFHLENPKKNDDSPRKG